MTTPEVELAERPRSRRPLVYVIVGLVIVLVMVVVGGLRVASDTDREHRREVDRLERDVASARGAIAVCREALDLGERHRLLLTNATNLLLGGYQALDPASIERTAASFEQLRAEHEAAGEAYESAAGACRA